MKIATRGRFVGVPTTNKSDEETKSSEKSSKKKSYELEETKEEK